MRSKIKLLKGLMLFCIGLYIAIKLANIWSTTFPLVHHYAFEQLMLRIVVCCMVLIYYLHLLRKKTLTNAVPLTNRYRLTIGSISVQLMMTFALLLLSSIKDTLWHPSVQPIVYFTSSLDFLCRGIIATVCLAAILEELLFRGILEKLLSWVIPIRLVITLISSLAFSLMHGNMSNNLFYFLMGCFLSHLYHQTKRIIYPIIAHGIHNLCAISIIYFKLDASLDGVINRLPLVTRTVLAIGALLAVYGSLTYMLLDDEPEKYDLH